MQIIKILPSFEKSIKNLSALDRNKIKDTLERFNNFLLYKTLTKGLGLKKLSKDIYEIRVDIRLRIIIKMEGDTVYFVVAGSHQDIKKYLEIYR